MRAFSASADGWQVLGRPGGTSAYVAYYLAGCTKFRTGIPPETENVPKPDMPLVSIVAARLTGAATGTSR